MVVGLSPEDDAILVGSSLMSMVIAYCEETIQWA